MTLADAKSISSQEEDLIQRAARGDVEPLSALYEAHVDGLYTFVLYRVGGDTSLAEDAVQETFLMALDKFSSYDPGRGSFFSWLCITSKNVTRKLLRAHQRGEELQKMWDRIDQALIKVFSSLEEAPLTDEILAREETKELVKMSIAQLPERYRVVLEGHYLKGESIKELMQRLSLTEDAAKSLLLRARRAFKETFSTVTGALTESAR
jgi:RNA polymerase sigma-70 factor, ECF subfamily